MADDQPKEQTQDQQALIPSERATPMREMLAVLKDTGDPELFRAFAHDIIEREVASARFGQDAQLARVFAGSGVFDGINGTAQGVSLAMTKIQLGRSWNMAPADAMEAINFINGRPSVATRYLAAKMQDAGISWDIEWDEENGSCTGCHLHLKRWNAEVNRYDPVLGRVNGKEQQAVVSFTKKDADNAMVHENGKQIKLSEKWNFKSWPSDMYFARCVSRVRVRYAANILSGILTREEAEDSGDTGLPGVSRGAERAAIASAAKTEEIGKKLTEARPPLTAPAQPKPAEQAVSQHNTPAGAPTASNVVPISADKAPWSDRKEMAGAGGFFAKMKSVLPASEFDGILGKHGLMIGSMRHDAPESLACYREMEARLRELQAKPAAVPEQAAPIAASATDDSERPLF